MSSHNRNLAEIWRQKKIPVVYREGKSKPLLVHLPFAANNQEWLKVEHRRYPKWIQRYNCWEVPKSWFEEIIKRLLSRFRRVYVIQPFRIMRKCAPACWNAAGFECECSCMGANHGSHYPGGQWHIISETAAVQWEDREFGCRLIENKGEVQRKSRLP